MFDKLAQCSGWQMYVNPNDNNVSDVIFQTGVWENSSTKIVREELKEGDVFIDCGAYIGYYTCLAATIVGEKGLVIAFEPSPRHFAYLRKNVELNGFKNIITLPFALWEEQRIMSIDEKVVGNLGDTRVNTTIIGETVQAYALDQIVSKADFIKTDCQGDDPNILKGARRLIESSENIKCLLEMNEWYPTLKELGLSIVKSIGEDQNIFVQRVKETQTTN